MALDTPDSISALRLVDDLKDAISWVKVGLQLFTAQGPAIVTALKERRLKVFLDLKFHDIPNTAHEAMRSAVRLGADMATIHLSGGSRMVRSAIEATAGSPLLVLGVTVLTSFDEAELRGIGVKGLPRNRSPNSQRWGVNVVYAVSCAALGKSPHCEANSVIP